MRPWTELLVFDMEIEDDPGMPLANFIRQCPYDAAGIELDQDGAIAGWSGWFVAFPGEVPDCDTPLEPVDWTGLADALAAGNVAGHRVVTYQDSRGNTIDICSACELALAGNWPRCSHTGEEYAQVAHGLHQGLCDICQPEEVPDAH